MVESYETIKLESRFIDEIMDDLQPVFGGDIYYATVWENMSHEVHGLEYVMCSVFSILEPSVMEYLMLKREYVVTFKSLIGSTNVSKDKYL